jgi:hypothetical protein
MTKRQTLERRLTELTVQKRGNGQKSKGQSTEHQKEE